MDSTISFDHHYENLWAFTQCEKNLGNKIIDLNHHRTIEVDDYIKQHNEDTPNKKIIAPVVPQRTWGWLDWHTIAGANSVNSTDANKNVTPSAPSSTFKKTPEETDKIARPDLHIQQGDIVFDKVSFTYPDKKTPIFKDLSVTIRAGERVALVGHSGGFIAE